MTPMKNHFFKRPHRNLVQSLREAESEDEISALMLIGKAYDGASDKTRSRWHEAAKVRRQQLSNGHSADTTE